MESKRRHFRLDMTDYIIMAELKNIRGEVKKLQINDISKQGISFYLEDWVVTHEWKKNITVTFEYAERKYEFGMNFV